jgi:hypothetical protein
VVAEPAVVPAAMTPVPELPGAPLNAPDQIPGAPLPAEKGPGK